MLPKSSTYRKRYDGENKCMIFWLKYNELSAIFGIKSVILLIKNSMENPSTIKKN